MGVGSQNTQGSSQTTCNHSSGIQHLSLDLKNTHNLVCTHTHEHTCTCIHTHVHVHTQLKIMNFGMFLNPCTHSILAYNSSCREVETGGLCVPSQWEILSQKQTNKSRPTMPEEQLKLSSTPLCVWLHICTCILTHKCSYTHIHIYTNKWKNI